MIEYHFINLRIKNHSAVYYLKVLKTVYKTLNLGKDIHLLIKKI